MKRKLSNQIVFLVIFLALMFSAVGVKPAKAYGVVSHAEIARQAILLLLQDPDPDVQQLATLLAANAGAVLAGSQYPDAYLDHGDGAHYPEMAQYYIEYLREPYSHAEDRNQSIAFLMGIISHHEADIAYHYEYLERYYDDDPFYIDYIVEKHVSAELGIDVLANHHYGYQQNYLSIDWNSLPAEGLSWAWSQYLPTEALSPEEMGEPWGNYEVNTLLLVSGEVVLYPLMVTYLPNTDASLSYVVDIEDAARRVAEAWKAAWKVLNDENYTGIYYVKEDGSDTADCDSWATACTLPQALYYATPGTQIWVAAGTYKPVEIEGTRTSVTDDERKATFRIPNAVKLYGGFPNTGEPVFADRDPAAHLTTLSGDLLGKDNTNIAWDEPTRADNSYHVVYAVDNRASEMNGFTITGGNANGDSLDTTGGGYNRGGGMVANHANIPITNVIFEKNSAKNEGGGIFVYDGGQIITNAVFRNNAAGSGGGLASWASGVALSNVTFSNNFAAINGGGVSLRSNYNLDREWIVPQITCTNVTISGNSAYDGGGVYLNDASGTFTNVTISGNTASHGGGMYNKQSSPTITNVTFDDNSADYGAGMYNEGSSPNLTDVTFDTNSSSERGGGMYNVSDSDLTIKSVTFTNNSAPQGAGMYNHYSSPQITNATISGNTATGEGGGIFNLASSPTITNVTISGNSASTGGGIHNVMGATGSVPSNPVITNTIVWGNGTQIVNADSSTPQVSNSVVQGDYSGGTNIITADPLLSTLGDYGGSTQTIPITANSPAINAGNNTYCTVGADQRGYNYVSVCDIGAYEYQYTYDFKTAPLSETFEPSSTTRSNWFLLGNAAFKTSGSSDVLRLNEAYTSHVGNGVFNVPFTVEASDYLDVQFNYSSYGGTGADGLAFYLLDGSVQPSLGDMGPAVGYKGVTGGYFGVVFDEYHGQVKILGSGSGDTGFNELMSVSASVGGSGKHAHIVFENNHVSVWLNNKPLINKFDLTTAAGQAALPSTFKFGFSGATGAGTNIHEVDNLNVQFRAPITGIRVTEDGATSGTCGSTWENACGLQYALAIAFPGDQLWVKQGTYKPYGTIHLATFQLMSGVAVYGGFAGTEEDTEFDWRDPEANVTILSGDTGTEGIDTDNSYHVVTGATGATLDGFTITGGKADASSPNNSGGGMYNNGVSQMTVANVTFSDNKALYGAGMYNEVSSPSLDHVKFIANLSAHRGGGMYNVSNSTPTITDVTFEDNTATSDGGGGMYNHYSSPILTNVTFSGNKATNGGGMFNLGSSPTVTSATFSINQATGTSNGGGMYNLVSGTGTPSNPNLTDVTFIGNSATFGGGMYTEGSSPSLTNVIFDFNPATERGGGMYNVSGSNLTIKNVTLSNNSADYGAGMYNHYSSPTITNATFNDNQAYYEGGGIFNLASSPHITNVTFFENRAFTGGGGIYNVMGAAGPVYSHPVITNTIVWNNGTQIVNADSSTATVTYSIVEGGYSGTGNLNVNPNLGTLGSYGGYTQTMPLYYWSPAINAGNDTVCTAAVGAPTYGAGGLDQRGVTRQQGAHCDIGAFEAQIFTLEYTAGEHGSINGTTSQSVYEGTSGIPVTAVPDTGYHFVSWSDGILTASRSDSFVTSNISVTANYTQNEYTLTVVSTHGTVTKNPNQATYHYGDVVQLTAAPAAGWSFTNWTGGLTGTTNPDSVTIHGNTSVTADYTQNEYTLTVNSAHGTVTKSPDQPTYHYGDIVTLSVTPATGWTFTGWTPSLTNNRVAIIGNTTVTANYTQNEYTLTVNSAHGTVTKSPDQTTYHYGDVVTLSVTPAAGWTFTDWTPSLTSNQVTITGNTTVTANYTQNEYTLTVNSAHGTVTKSPDQATYHYGDVVTLSVTPEAGWTFTGWTPSLTDNQVTIIGNTTVTANVTQDAYILTVNSAHGTVTKSPDQSTYHYGDVVTLSVTPDTGWAFANWTPSLTDNQVTIIGNTTITANYTQDAYTLTVNSVHGTVTKSPDQPTYQYGAVVTLSITPDAGWTFSGWTPALTDNQVTITGNTTVTANYNGLPTDITISSTSVSENLPAGTTVGTLSTVDPDTGDTHTYSLACSTPGLDDASFTIVGNAINTAAVFDYETKNAYNICIRTDDGHGGTFDKEFTITVNNLPEPISITLRSTGAQDGWLLESGETTLRGGTMDATATTLRLGDDAAKKQYRSLLSFATGAALPDSAIITKVTLKVRRQAIVGGGNPVSLFKGFMVDIRRGIFGTSALQITDWQAPAHKSYGPFNTVAVGGWYAIDLTASKAYINKLATYSGLTQFRLGFKLDDNNNTIANYLSLYSGNAPLASRPQLIIEYYVP